MSKLRRYLLLGSLSMLLLAGGLFTSNFKTPAAHAAPAFSQACPSTRSEGSSGPLVQVIQFRLNSLNADGNISHSFGNPFPLATDGIFGSETTKAVKDFQSSPLVGLSPIDGIVGDATWGAMGFCIGLGFLTCCFSTSNSHVPATIEEGSTGTFVIELQRGLNEDADATAISGDGWFPLQVDGNFGTKTADAVKSLQKAGGITQDGIVGPNTWAVFGMSF